MYRRAGKSQEAWQNGAGNKVFRSIRGSIFWVQEPIRDMQGNWHIGWGVSIIRGLETRLNAIGGFGIVHYNYYSQVTETNVFTHSFPKRPLNDSI